MLIARGRAALRRVRDWDRSLIGILLLAAVIRLPWPGLLQFEWDELHLLYESQRLARDGDWVWLSNVTSWSVIPGHSPFSNYVAALPYLFTLDPRAHRVMIGLMGVAAVGIVYWTMRRYFGRWAAIMTGATLATAPMAVAWSRSMWHPDIAQPLMALWILTGLMGYYEGHRWAQITHWLALSLAVQADMVYGLHLPPLSLLLLIVGWFRPQADRRALVRATAWGWGLALLTAVPWIIGLIDAGMFENLGQVETREQHYSQDYLRLVTSLVVSSTEFWGYHRTAAGDGWWPPLRYEGVLWFRTWLTFAGALWLLIEVRRRRWEAVPGALLALMVFFPLITFVVSPAFTTEWYLMPMMFGAVGVQGIILSRLGAFRSWARWPVAVFVCAALIMQGWVLLGAYRWLRDHGTEKPFYAPLYVHQNLLDEWSGEADHIVALMEVFDYKYTQTLQSQWWAVLGRQYGVQVLTMPQGVPIHPDGQVLVSHYDGAAIPMLFGEGEVAGRLSDGQPMFRKVVIPPNYLPDLSFVPENLSRFANGARVVGISASGDPQPGLPWQVVLAWTPEQSKVGLQYQFSIRLVGGDGTTYAQWDGPSLDGWLWRADDLVLNGFDLLVSDSLPPETSLKVQVLMYTWPDIAGVDAVNDQGAVAAPWLYLVPVQPDTAAMDSLLDNETNNQSGES